MCIYAHHMKQEIVECLGLVQLTISVNVHEFNHTIAGDYHYILNTIFFQCYCLVINLIFSFNSYQ